MITVAGPIFTVSTLRGTLYDWTAWKLECEHSRGAMFGLPTAQARDIPQFVHFLDIFLGTVDRYFPCEATMPINKDFRRLTDSVKGAPTHGEE